MTTDDSPRTIRISAENRDQFQEDLLDGLRQGLDSPTPGALLLVASMLLDITTDPDVPPERTAEIVRGLESWDRVETSAGALTMATLSGDADLRRWVRRALADRGHLVPRWLVELPRSTPAARAVEVSGPFRDIDELVVGVETPDGCALTAVVRVDNELGARAVGALLVERPLDTVVERLRSTDDPDRRVRDIPPADARARLTAALRADPIDALFPRIPDWHLLRPLVRWMLTFLPAGGDATVLIPVEDVDLDALAREFLASTWGRPWTRGSLPALVDAVLGDGLANGIGDPLLWAPHHVRRLLDLERAPFELADHLHVAQTPEVLRDLIRHGHARRGLRPELTDESLAAVDRYADAFLEAVRAWDDDEAI